MQGDDITLVMKCCLHQTHKFSMVLHNVHSNPIQLLISDNFVHS